MTTSNTIAVGLLEEFEREVVTTRKFLGRLPGDKLAWRPHAKSMSAGQLGYHVAETPEMVLRMAMKARTSPPDLRVRQEASTVDELLALLDSGSAYVRATLPTVDDAAMMQTFILDLPNGAMIEMPRLHCVRNIMLNHWYHHRGQLGVYLRLLGAVVPSSYGPSGDEGF